MAELLALVVGSVLGGATTLAYRELSAGQWRGRLETEVKEVIRRLSAVEDTLKELTKELRK